MKEALLYTKHDNKVRCDLCHHHCVLNPGQKGLCKVRENVDGTLYTLVYGRAIAGDTDPVEKKPLHHFYPGSQAYSVATPGCNFSCIFCQNWEISQVKDESILQMGKEMSPEDIVSAAEEAGCESIAYTYTEPTVFFEYSYDTMRLAHERGIKNIYVSNGYMTSAMLEMAEPFLDAVNIDLKGFRENEYRRLAGAQLKPVLDNLKRIRDMDIWLEVTSLLIPGVNDTDAEIRHMAEFVAGELGEDTPWHLSRFFPAYKMQDVPPTPLKTLKKAREAGREAGLHYVYIGNVADKSGMDTRCPECGRLLIERRNGAVTEKHLRSGHCPDCGTEIAGVFH